METLCQFPGRQRQFDQVARIVSRTFACSPAQFEFPPKLVSVCKARGIQLLEEHEGQGQWQEKEDNDNENNLDEAKDEEEDEDIDED